MKEYEHDRGQKGDLSEDKILEISKVLARIEKGDEVCATYFFDGYNHQIKGKGEVDIASQVVTIANVKINFLDLVDIEIVKKRG